MKVMCAGCGSERNVREGEIFVCDLCGTRNDTSARGFRLPVKSDVPDSVRRAFASGGAAAETRDADNFRFLSVRGGYAVTGISRGVIFADIPARHMGMPVVEIGAGAFAGTDLVSVNLPRSVRKISDGAFENCVCLVDVNGGAGLEWVGARAFRNCIALSCFNVESMPDADITAFAGCYSLGAAGERVSYSRSI